MSMAVVAELLQVLGDPSSACCRLSSDDLRPGLEWFLSVLESGIAGDDDDDDPSAVPRFKQWTQPQIDAVIAVGKLIVSTAMSAPVAEAESLVFAIVGRFLDLIIALLEKSEFHAADLSWQNGLARLLETALMDVAEIKSCYATPSEILNGYAETLSVIPVKAGSPDLCNYPTCDLEGFRCSKGGSFLQRILLNLSSESLQLDSSITLGFEQMYCQSSKKMATLACHYAVVHLKLLPRVLILCKELMQNCFSEYMMDDAKFSQRLSLCHRMLKFLGNIARETINDSYDKELLSAVTGCADILPMLFRLQIDLANYDCFSKENSCGGLTLLVLEEFLKFTETLFFKGTAFNNIQTCLISSILKILDNSVWRYDPSNSSVCCPLVYFPHVVIYLLKLLRDVVNRVAQIPNLENSVNLSDHFSESDARILSCHISSEDVFLLKKYTADEHLRIIFSPSRSWVDDLMHLVFILYTEGIRLSAKVDKSCLGCTKPSVGMDLEGTTNNEDEALFGNLFSEAGRPAGSADGNDQPATVSVTTSSNHNLHLEAANELLNFLNAYIFKPDLFDMIYNDACQQLEGKHVSGLLSILNVESSNAPPSKGSSGHVNDACFGLLRNLVISHAFSSSIQGFLVDNILKVEGGMYCYNSYTLKLLAYFLISRAGSDIASVTNRIFLNFVDFILQKTNEICCGCLELPDLLETIPCAFHLEILLVAFHLSSQTDKAFLLSILCASLKKVSVQSCEFESKDLFFWSLLVSRLVLMLKHIVLYPSICPTWLLLRLKSRLVELPNGEHSSNSSSDYLSSWAMTVVDNVLHHCHQELPVLGRLRSHLIDIVPRSPAIGRSNIAFENFGVDTNDLLASLSCILSFWKGRKAVGVEELIVERYLFLVCWDVTLNVASGAFYPQSFENSCWNIDLLNSKSLFQFGQLVMFTKDDDKDVKLPDIVLDLLKLLHDLHLRNEFAGHGWDFFRSSAWLSLALFVLNAGIWKYSLSHKILQVEPYVNLPPPRESGFSILAEDMILDILGGDRGGQLFSSLSLILKDYLEILENAFISTLGRSNKDRCSSLVLLKHSKLEKCSQVILHKTSSLHPSCVESIFDLLSNLDELASKEGKGYATSAFTNFMLHGFPSHSEAPSGALLSCVIIVREIISFMDAYLKIQFSRGSFHLENADYCRFLDSVITINHDKIFQHINKKCKSIYTSMTSHKLDIAGYSELFVLKQLENFLTDMNCMESIDADTHEALIIDLVDFIGCLQGNDATQRAFMFYLGSDEGLSEEAKELCAMKRGDLLILISALDKCQSEIVDVKVLCFFVGIFSGGSFPGIKEQVQKKFLEMDLVFLSAWLERRLLGRSIQSQTGVVAKDSFVELRETTMLFIMELVSLPCDLSRDLRCRFIKAMLVSLDSAFMLHDVQTAKVYLGFVVQILNEKSSVRQLLVKIASLIGKLADNEGLLEGLKFLLGFLSTFLGVHGANKNVTDKPLSKLNPTAGSGVGSAVSCSAGSKKNPENLVLSVNEGSNSSLIDGDATSADEDEDDGTSDGELGSFDMDEEDDGNSERALASKVCTFTSSGSNFMEQHWYFCYTCDLIVSKGCCSICAKVCHRGHRVVYSRSSRFFCDCGAGGVRGSSCQCLQPRKFSGNSTASDQCSSGFQSIFPFQVMDQAPDSGSDLEDDVFVDSESSYNFLIPDDIHHELPSILKDIDIEDRILELCNNLLSVVINRRNSNMSKDKKVVLGDDKVLTCNVDILQLRKAYKNGSLDLKIKTDYPNSRDLKSHLTSGSLKKSLLTISLRGRLAVGEGDKVTIFDLGQLIGPPAIAPVTADKINVKPLSRNIVRFEVVTLLFNPAIDNYLAVAGYEECQVLTINSRGEVTDRLAIELALQGAYIRRVEWVPGSQVQLMVVTSMFVKIFDLSQDNISPLHYLTLSDDAIVDATLVPAFSGKIFLLVLSRVGCLFRIELSVEGAVGARAMKDSIPIVKKEFQSAGLSLYFSCSHRLLFLSYQDGSTMIGRLDANATALTEVSMVYEEDQDGKTSSAGLHHWKELPIGSGVFSCLSSVKSYAAFAINMDSCALYAQNMRYGSSSTFASVGIAAYRPSSKDKAHCLVLHDDGGLQIYSRVPLGLETATNSNLDTTRKLGSSILSNKAYAGMRLDFPLDFFEKTTCITTDVKWACDAIKNCESEEIKKKLTSDDGFLESSNSAGFKVTVSLTNQEQPHVMVGFRVHVGNMSPSHIPSEITIFQRSIKLDDGMRSWYDVPFTVAESLLADEEFTISVGRTFDGISMPRIDSLEVYGRAKDEFGWKEKVEAFMDMEAHGLGSGSSAVGVGKKHRATQTTSIHEQVLADSLKLLSRVYLLWRFNTADASESNSVFDRFKCKKLLETIFQSDREPFLQSAACHVLQVVFPKREMYYQEKDTMRLLGVLNSASMLISRIEIGGVVEGWVIKEFTEQLHAISKIALHRRSNLARFLQIHGSGLVDSLMQVLWNILDLERPETKTINSIVIPSVELIYSYAECLALHGSDPPGSSVAPAVALLKKLLFAKIEAVQTSSSLAISSRLLQVPFPKQTMLVPDDAPENTTAHLHSDANSTSGNPQVMIEEDSTASSVHYSCDGCSTVPILRRRWHCTICPDFDLCEACYEVLDADHLPPPHTRDHAMAAIAIEMDSLGDGNEVHFSMDDFPTARMASDASIQHSSRALLVLETTEAGDFHAPIADQTVVSISASKRTVNSLLLREFVGELEGWMEWTSGARAIPVMQLFYRLSSTVGGPFVDGSKNDKLNLESFVKWLLDEINPNKVFAVKARSSFGEAIILVFMFFTLMLRNWHQPGNEGAQQKSSLSVVDSQENISVPNYPSASISLINNDQERAEFNSQLVRACSYLRQQSFVNYLMDILQQLLNFFKSSPLNLDSGSSSSSGCGSLLTVRRELPVGNYSPFFSDSYAKSHRTDLFIDYHKLLLENTFRLVYSLVRPEKQDKSAEKDRAYKSSVGKDLKLDGFQDVLCSYISNPNTNFVRRYARRLFLHLCGSKTQYYSTRDSWLFSNEVKRFYKLITKSGGFSNPISYERSVKLVKCLTAISEVASARPRNWQKYCSKHTELLSFLLSGIFYFGEESVVQTLKLLNLAFYTGKDVGYSFQKADGDTGATKSGTDSRKKRKGEDGTETSSEKSYLDMEQSVEVFSCQDGSVLRNFINAFLLDWNSTSVRLEAKCVLCGIWRHAKQSFKEAMLNALLLKVKSLPMYGQNIVEYFELVICLLSNAPDSSAKMSDSEIVSKCLTHDVISCISEMLHSQNELLANHPNSSIYNTLSSLVEFDGYYLESKPCVACSCPEVPYGRTKLENLKSETKFTDNRIIVKCTGSFTIQAVTMNVHDARRSKSVKVLNLYYNNRPVADLSELKNNWSMWKRAKSCHLGFNQTELKVEFPIPITACNFMIELDSFYENLQASSVDSLQCPRCSRPVTDRYGICSSCHENAFQCRQCRNINYENLDSFLCNECGYSKYGRFEFNFMAKPSFSFDSMETDEDMKNGLAAIESESDNAHRRYQQLLGFKKPLLKLVSSIGEHEIDSQQKDTVQQTIVSLPGPSGKINRKIALLGVLYGEKCKAAFDSVSKSIQTLQGLRRVLMNYLHFKTSNEAMASSRFSVPRSTNNCYGCAITLVSHCMELLQVLSKHANCKRQLVASGILSEIFENNIHHGPKPARVQARAVLCAFSEGDANVVSELNSLIQKKVMYCLEHHRSMDVAVAIREELFLLSETCAIVDEHWEARLRVAFQLLFASIKLGAKNPAISEHVILPCLRIISQACIPPKFDASEKELDTGKVSALSHSRNDGGINSSPNSISGASKVSSEIGQKGQDIPLLSYSEWERGASYLDFVRRQYKAAQAVKSTTQRARLDSQRCEYLMLKYALKWKRHACRRASKSFFSTFELGSWVSELILSACSQTIRSEVCTLISLLCPQASSRRFQLLNLLMSLLPASLSAGESAAEYFELFFKMIDSEAARFMTVRGCLTSICKLMTEEVRDIESQERSLCIDISQGFILHKLIELLSKFLEVPNIRTRFMRDELLSEVLEASLVVRGLVVQKTKLISDCGRLLKDLLDSLLLENTGNKSLFIRACISGLQIHRLDHNGRTSLFILEQLCDMICPVKPESIYLLILNKAPTQEEYTRGSMNKNPYSSTEIGPLMRDVKNKICRQLDLLSFLEDDYGVELLVAGSIISLDLSISQVYEQFWKKHHNQSQNAMPNAGIATSGGSLSVKDYPPMTVTYRLQGLDGEATEPMIKDFDEEREESQDPEVEFAIASVVRECGGLEVILSMIQSSRVDELKSNREELSSVLNLLLYCCKIRENRRALLKLGALGILLETARRAFSVDAMEPAEGILLIVESLALEANESDIGISHSVLSISNEEGAAGEQAKKIVLMFLERLCHSSGLKKTNKQQRNDEMVARILPYLTYGVPSAMEALVHHFDPYLRDWGEFDSLQKRHKDNPKDEQLAQQAIQQRCAVENFVRVSESLKTSSCGEGLKDIILEKGITIHAVKHLRECFAITGQAGFKSSLEWTAGLKLLSIPLILSMLRGLSKGHMATQICIDNEEILPLLHALEGVPGENEIGARAENLLDVLADEGDSAGSFLGDKVKKLRDETREEMRRRAFTTRMKTLQGLGMRQEFADGSERIIVSHPVIEGLDDVEEEDGLACMVCREGYCLQPEDILGVYSYSKRVNLGTASSGSSARWDCVYTTVSHFNVIHFKCHQEAKRADAELKNPKKEWEGAALRNNRTLCNCIFPLRGPAVPISQYVRCMDQYWDSLNVLGRADGSRIRLLTYDIVLMLARFATGACFNTDCKGGGRESNSKLLPFMIQMASYLLDQGGSIQRMALAKSVSAYFSPDPADSPTRSSSPLSSATSRSPGGPPDETIQFMMVNSLLSEPYEAWVQHRPAFLQRGIYHAYMQHKHGNSTLRLSSDPASSVVKSDGGSSSTSKLDDGSKLFGIIQPMLVYVGLIEQLQRFFKRNKASSVVATASKGLVDSESGSLESWEVIMMERLLNMKEMATFSKELLAWLEDMLTSVDLQEAFDTIGALGDALSGGCSSCEEFVRAAILAGKS